ncbi:hypothetical protein Bca101_001993 [Brassica carinata]
MDLQLKQWRSQQVQTESEPQPSAAKIPRHAFDPIQSQTATSTVLPLFAPEPASSKLSSLCPDSSSRFSKIGSFFSWAQWQELELQALIYRYMLAGAAVPQELLLPIKKSLLHLSPSYFLQHLPHYQPAWGRWILSQGDAGERMVRSGDVQGTSSLATSTASATCTVAATVQESLWKLPPSMLPPPLPWLPHPQRHRHQHHLPLLLVVVRKWVKEDHLVSSSLVKEMKQERNNNKRPYESHNGFGSNGSDGGHILRHFFDDWPRSEADNSSSPMSSATCLSISMPGNSSSDVSLKLSTGNEEEARSNNIGRDQQNMSWWSGGGTNHNHHHMGGPLAEALRSSSSSSPTSVLHQLGVSTQAFH